MGRKNSRSPRRDRQGAEVWTDDAMRDAKPYPLPEVPGPEAAESERPPAPRRLPAGEPGLVKGVPPQDA
jgi:hypothetical protein